MTEIMPVPRNLILLSYQQGASFVLFLFSDMLSPQFIIMKAIISGLSGLLSASHFLLQCVLKAATSLSLAKPSASMTPITRPIARIMP